MNKYLKDKEFSEKLIQIRSDFHQYPEISHEEFETTKKIHAYVTELGYEVLDIGLPTGLVARLKGKSDRPAILLRADIDALPITEMSDKPYASKVEGKMHACGHDVHTTILIGAAEILADQQDQLEGSVYLLFQPAEEVNEGARMVIDKGLFEKYNIDYVLGQHNQPLLPSGTVGIHEGGLMAAVDTLRVTVTGKGGHGAMPNETIDPIVATAAMIHNLQSIVSRNIFPLEGAVISIGYIQGGLANNVIPDSVKFTGTVRSFSDDVRKTLHKRIYEVLENTAKSYQVDVDIEYIFHLPPVLNAKEYTDLAKEAVADVLGMDAIQDPTPSMGGEDFSLLLEQAPGVFLWLGTGNPEKGIQHVWHHPSFDADESAFATGAVVMAEIAKRMLKKEQEE